MASAHNGKPSAHHRRAFLFALCASPLSAQEAGSGKGQVYPSDMRRYADPATEFQVVRLTSPDYTSRLTASNNRSMAGRGVLFYCCDRTGSFEIYRLELKSGQSRQLTAGSQVDPGTLALLPGDRSLCYFDGPSLRLMNLSGSRDRELYRLPPSSERGRGMSVSPDGSRIFFVERSGSTHRIRAAAVARQQVTTVVESSDELADPLPRPGRAALLYRKAGSLCLAGLDGRDEKRLALAPGEALCPTWTPDGNSVLYLNVAPERGQLNTLRELEIEGATNRLIARTTQFIAFGTNSDATVFVGASGSKASPHVLILLRSVRRELTLCEHRSADPSIVAPIFAPSSQQILFVSDRHGKPAIYTMNVERFVEETES